MDPGYFAAGDGAQERYRLDLLLGKGGAGAVYKAYDRELDRSVAIKILHAELLQQPGCIRRLRDEVSLATRISHPNVVRVYDFASIHGVPAIAMQFVPGPTLQELLRSRGPMPAREAVNIFEQVVAGTAAGHAVGVVHGDIKPANIIVSSNSAYLADFGVAGSFQPERMGTPSFAPPELSSGPDPRSDVYSLALTFICMVQGSPPPNNDPEALSEAMTAVPRALRSVISKCLCRDIGNRYSSATELLDALGKVRSANRSRSLRIALTSAFSLVLILILIVLNPFAGKISASHPARRIHVDVVPFTIEKSSRSDIAETLRTDLARRLAYCLSGQAILPADVIYTTPLRAFHGGPHTQGAVTVRGSMFVGDSQVNVKVIASVDDKALWTTAMRVERSDITQLLWRIMYEFHAHLNTSVNNKGLAIPVSAAYDQYLLAQKYLLPPRDTASRPLPDENVNVAINALQAAKRIDPRFVDPYYALLRIHTVLYRNGAKGAFTEAQSLVRELVDHFPGPETRYAHSGYLISIGRATEAVADLRRLSNEMGDSTASCRLLGLALDRLDLSEDAIEAYKRGLRRSDDMESHNSLAALYLRTYRATDAVREFQAVLAQRPQSPAATSNLGSALLLAGRVDEAATTLRNAITWKSGPAAYNLGLALYYKGDLMAAAEAFQQAIQLEPNADHYWAGLGGTYLALGKSQKANAAYATARNLAANQIRSAPSNARLRAHLALYAAYLGELESAAHNIGAARRMAPGDVEVLRLQAMVEALAGDGNAILHARRCVERGYPVGLLLRERSLSSIRDELQRVQ